MRKCKFGRNKFIGNNLDSSNRVQMNTHVINLKMSIYFYILSLLRREDNSNNFSLQIYFWGAVFVGTGIDAPGARSR